MTLGGIISKVCPEIPEHFALYSVTYRCLAEMRILVFLNFLSGLKIFSKLFQTDKIRIQVLLDSNSETPL